MRTKRISATVTHEGKVSVVSYRHTPNQIRFDVENLGPRSYAWVTRAKAKKIRDALTRFLAVKP